MTSAVWYRDGTATSAQGSRTIVGSGTLWAVQARRGDLFAFLNNGGATKIYEIDSVADNTHLSLVNVFYEADVVNGEYVVIRNFNNTMTSETNAMLVAFLREWKLALQNNFKGEPGDRGENGNTVYSQSGVPSVALGVDGDFCLVTSTWNMYRKTAGAWVLLGKVKGADGMNGNTVLRNNGVPSNSLGVDGDWCIDYSNWDMYHKSAGAWGPQGKLKGADGMNGNTLLSSSGAPSSGLGANGDWCLDYTTWDMFRKESGTWVLRGNLQGGKGEDGAPGTKWHSATSDPSSAIGALGDFALNVVSWDIFRREVGGWVKQGNIQGGIGPEGPPGLQGVPGEKGAPGTAGSRWHAVGGIPSTGLGVDTDMALDWITSNVYRKEAGIWVQKSNIGGKQGIEGPQGIPGITWKGEWSGELVCETRDAVYHNGSTYLALQPSVNQIPPSESNEFWQILARRGTDGSGAGDMTKEDYDGNDDGKVNAADTADTAGYATSAGRATAADTADAVAWENVSDRPTSYPPAPHALDAHPAITFEEFKSLISDKTPASTDPATTSAAGLVALATADETATGMDNEKAVTSAGVAAALARGATVLTAVDLNSEDYLRHGAWITPALGLMNLPSGFVGNKRYMVVTTYHPNYSVQTIFSLNHEAMGDCASRFISGASTFSSWQIMYTSQNLLGTVSQSNGVPTGAVIERGSNANGEYVRFADGTLICSMAVSLAGGVTLATGSIYTSTNSVQPTPPSVFTASGVINVYAHDASSTYIWVAVSSSLIARAYSSIGTITSDRPIRITAIGRWF